MKTALLFFLLVGTAHAEDPKCVVEKPRAAPVTSARPAACHRAPARLARAITAEIVEDYYPERGGKPVVKFPCDGLGPEVFEVVVEHGAGHGGSLELWRAKRRADGKFEVRGILYRGSSMMRGAATVPHQQAAGVVELPALDKVRAAMTATVKEVTPPRKGALGMRSSFSSRDFHTVLRLVDDTGRVVERRYTGYATSGDQDAYLGLEIAFEALAPIWQLEANPKLDADDDDRAFFAASFAAAVPHFDRDGYWWVMERYVDLARFLGTRAVIGGLLARLTLTDKANRSQVDARADALDALARITRWDTRPGKSLDEAAAAYLAACK